MKNKPIIGFAGMTHLGLNSAVAAAQKGFRAIGFDPSSKLISQLQSGRTDITEPDLSEMLVANSSNLDFSSSPEILKKCDMVYISLDVPTDDKGMSDLTPVRNMIEVVNGSISEDALLIVLCQVPPGFTRSIKRKSEKLYYQVETLIFGRAMERALHPERYIIGCTDPSQKIDPRYAEFLQAYDCLILPMRYESAELAKTAINLFLAASVSTANTLAEICEKIGADWSEIIPSLQLDKRIGKHAYIYPGLGLSGGNIERDLKTVSQIGYEEGAKVVVPMAYVEHSQYRKKWPIRAFFDHCNTSTKDLRICILGLTYKENTHSIKNSPAINLLEALPDVNINVYDPVIKELQSKKKLKFCQTAEEAAMGSDMLFLMTAWGEFKTLDWGGIKASMRGDILIDPYGIIPQDKNTSKKFRHLILGKG